jgi:hypothetical protein
MRKKVLLSNPIQPHQSKRKRLKLQNYGRLIVLAIMLSILIAACASQQPEFPTGVFEFDQQRITFEPDGTYTVWNFAIESFDVEDGQYTVDGNEITLLDEAEDCGLAEGHYTWEFDGKKLLFEVVEDSCEGRSTNLKRGNWFIKP